MCQVAVPGQACDHLRRGGACGRRGGSQFRQLLPRACPEDHRARARKAHVGKHHGARGDGHFLGRKGCDIFLEGDTEALGKELSFLSSGSVSQ